MRLSKSAAAKLGLTLPKSKAGKRCPNRLEADYANHLEILKRIGDIVDYKYESVKLKVGVNTSWYTPDFWILAKDGVTEFHETKGSFFRDDAKAKLKAAALIYPHFRFFLVRRDGQRWRVEVVE